MLIHCLNKVTTINNDRTYIVTGRRKHMDNSEIIVIKPKQEDIATEVTSVVMAQVSCCRGVGH